MGWESFGVVGFDLGLLFQGQMRIPKLKIVFNLLVIGYLLGNLLVWSNLTLGSSFNSK